MWQRRRRSGAEPRPDVVVVTRAGCHLCEVMLATVGAEVGTEAAVRAVDVDAALAQGEITGEQHERWTTLVPVLLVDGREVAHHRVEPGRVRGLVGRPVGGRAAALLRRFGGSGGATLE